MNFDAKDTFSQIKAFLLSENGRKVLVIAGVVGIGLLFLSDLLPNASSSELTVSAQSDTAANDYALQLEARLTEIIKRVEGAGTCRVMVTLENGTEYLYAQEEKNDRYSNDTEQEANTEKSYVLYDSENGKQALVITEIQPEVKGVVVVCNGGKNVTVQQRVIEVVTTALGISSAKVCVTPMA